MSQPQRPLHTEHPVALGSFRSWLRVMRSASHVDRAFLPRAAFVCAATLLSSPLRIAERITYGRRVRATAIHPEPIFIIGHWRSGTTHLHNLLTQDSSLGFISTFQSMAPGFCIVGRHSIKNLLATKAAARYPTRLIDNIPLRLDAPQEDEFAIASSSHRSFLHAFSLPQQATRFFDRYVMFDGMDESERDHWSQLYLRILRKATFLSGDRRLVLKNCANTGRIEQLLALFPRARFIHIHRNPYDVFRSTLHLHRTVLPRSQLQHVGDPEIESNVLSFYSRLMTRYLETRSLIPSGQLVEVGYEDLVQDALSELSRIYGALSMSGFDDAQAAFSAYIESISDYKRNRYSMDTAVIKAVNQAWSFAFDAWGYERLAVG